MSNAWMHYAYVRQSQTRIVNFTGYSPQLDKQIDMDLNADLLCCYGM